MEAAALALSVACIAIIAALLMNRRATVARRALERLRDTDRLTGLPDRSQLRDWIEAALAEEPHRAGRLALFLVELRRLESVDSTYGHETADALIADAARSLKASVDPKELLVRYRGPQFVIACADPGDAERVRERAGRLLDAVQQRYEVGADRVGVTAAIGCVLSDDAKTDAETLLADARVALQHAMSGGKGAISLFDPGMRDAFSPEVAELRLGRALEDGEFTLLFLPVVELDPDHHLIGVEALLRWDDPATGLVDPARFLPTLDATGLINDVGQWAIDEACRQARIWQERFPHREIDVTVNISPRQLDQADFAQRVLATIRESGVDPERLSMELTGDDSVADLDDTSRMLDEIRALGVGLTLDDFGAGHASVRHLRHLRADALKIDRSFVGNLTSAREDEAVVQQMIGLAHALGMPRTGRGRRGCGPARGPAEPRM